MSHFKKYRDIGSLRPAVQLFWVTVLQRKAQPGDYILNATEAVTHPYNQVTKYNLQGKQFTKSSVQIFATIKTA